MATIRTCALTFDGKGFKWDAKDKVTATSIIIADLKKKGYDYSNRSEVLFITTFELGKKRTGGIYH